jgi:uncharacterized protein YpmB
MYLLTHNPLKSFKGFDWVVIVAIYLSISILFIQEIMKPGRRGREGYTEEAHRQSGLSGTEE